MSSRAARQPEQLTIAGEIPALIWRGLGEGPRPVIVYMHGGGHTKWDVDRSVIEHIPSQGVTLLSFDLYLHGDRIPPEGKPQERTADRFLTSMERCAHDLFTVLDCLRSPRLTAGTFTPPHEGHCGDPTPYGTITRGVI